MEVSQFFDKYGAAIIAVFGTISGVLITAFANLLLKKNEWINQKRLRKLERSIAFEERNLIVPIVEYIEAELQHLQRIYAKGFERDTSTIPEMLQEHHWKMVLTSARVKVYGNKELIDRFESFTRKRIEIGNFALDPKNKNLNLAYGDLKEAESIAAEILTTLKNKLSDIET
jgi:hypothetical protein